jgi:hypothetical protein
VMLEPDDAAQLSALFAQPQLLGRRLQAFEGLVQRRELRVADELRLDRVRRVLDRQDARGQLRIGEVEPTPGSTCAGRRRRDR